MITHLMGSFYISFVIISAVTHWEFKWVYIYSQIWNIDKVLKLNIIDIKAAVIKSKYCELIKNPDMGIISKKKALKRIEISF